MLSPQQCFERVIARWEGGLSLDPDDNGNWTGAKKGVGVLIGSNRGVTPAALALARGVSVTSLTQADMRGITIAEAARIGVQHYYRDPRLDLLTWCRATASIVDFGWGAGPAQAVKLVQRMVDVPADGRMGPVTAAAYNALLAAQGEEFVAGAWWTVRDAFYEQIIGTTPSNAKYERGWDNRNAWWTPGHREHFWQEMAA